MGSDFEDMWAAVVSMIIFGFILTSFFTIANIYVADEKAEINDAYNKEAVTDYPEDLTASEKDLVLGAAVLNEILAYPEGTYVKVNGTAITNLKSTPTKEDYVTYSKKYGTELLERYISVDKTYKRKVTLDDEGNISGVSYKLVY